jgi:hypothetical protein
VLRDPKLLRRLVTTRGPVLLADAYFRGQIDVEGDLYSALALKDHFEGLAMPWPNKHSLLLDAWRLPSRTEPASAGTLLTRLTQRFNRQHTRHSDRQAIAFHYDVSNDFYALWLDAERVYSCAYFETAEDTLDQAQQNRLEHMRGLAPIQVDRRDVGGDDRHIGLQLARRLAGAPGSVGPKVQPPCLPNCRMLLTRSGGCRGGRARVVG